MNKRKYLQYKKTNLAESTMSRLYINYIKIILIASFPFKLLANTEYEMLSSILSICLKYSPFHYLNRLNGKHTFSPSRIEQILMQNNAKIILEIFQYLDNYQFYEIQITILRFVCDVLSPRNTANIHVHDLKLSAFF